MIEIIISVVVFCVWLILTIFNHFHIISFWENKERTQVWWHRLEATIRGIILSRIILFHTGYNLVFFYFLFLGILIWWVFFDMGLNKKRKKPLLYVGYNSYLDKTTRYLAIELNKKIPAKINFSITPEILSLILKILLLLATIIIPFFI